MDIAAPNETAQIEVKDPFDRFLAPVLFLGAAVLYNAILAFLNAHVMHVSEKTVIMAEGIIVLGACAYMATKLKFLRDCQPIFLFQIAMLVIFCMVTLLSEFLNVKAFRDIFLITVFTLLGTLTNEKSIIRLYTVLAAITLAVLLLEAFATETYAMIFNPASYYGATRGLENPDFNDTGIFLNAMSFEGRFTLGIINVSHRISSIFIEQVSLGNFAIILTMFTSLLWDKLGYKARALLVFTIFMIVATNNSRTALALCLIFSVGHFIFPKLPRFTHVIYLPLIIVILLSMYGYDNCNENIPVLISDDLKGRLNTAYCSLANMKPSAVAGAESSQSRVFWDSGIAYFIYSQSLLGFLVLYCLVSFLLKPTNKTSILLNHYLSLIIFANLTTSMALFSIKVSAPIWFLCGYIYIKEKQLLINKRII
ncbi:MAG: hypothetical protein RBR86_03950 [Pseudobdellovibrionaceae bacterium]|jgi:hypothetical protein|nr:hypothetical protein [Pseudobdellovibrionaceae bacterium]